MSGVVRKLFAQASLGHGRPYRVNQQRHRNQNEQQAFARGLESRSANFDRSLADAKSLWNRLLA
jgi:hypothetical protein